MDWPKIVFEQIMKVNNALSESYEMEVEKLKDVLYPYWKGEDGWQEIMDGIEFIYQQRMHKIHNPPTDADMKNVTGAKIERSRSIFRALMDLIHNSTGLLPHKEVEGVISEYRPDETTIQETA